MGVKVDIVTDSTAYLTEEYLENNPHVHVVPLTVNCGGEVIEDWTGNNQGFKDALGRMSKEDAVPTTSQPSPGRFAEVFEVLLAKGHEIITVTISSNLSGTVQSVLNARSLVGHNKISVVDSYSTAASLRMLVEDAAAAASEGRSRADIVSMLEGKKNRIKLLLLPSSLEHLRRGGRIGGAQALVGSLLNIRPVLCVTDDGYVEVLEKVRTHKKALNRMVEELPDNCVRAVIGHFLAEDTADDLRKLVENKIGISVSVQEVGPVIATHVGPGVVGLFFEIPKV